ncbi:hypothetical protein ACJRO7_028206 [Eucalyptus globulus]|uniref:Leucine-rich repeat-containing N-terminal plant-type domain-containing protein n=1 Tax=Eucalyptus globulus TaxID=34317 RepID=A0ABD3JV03_EUCGL
MASYTSTGFVPTLLCALLVIQALKFSHSNALTNVSCIRVERESLMKFKHDLIDPSERLSSWTGKDCCKWEGVECNEETSHVSKLDLRNPCDGPWECTLGGKIHPAVYELNHLKYLDLSFNNFSTQKIPASLASLQNLEYLNLSHGGFYGDLPGQLSNLSKLQYLDLSSDQWEHPLQTNNLQWLSTFSKLKYLDLSCVSLLNPKEWLSPINMLSSLEVLILRGCYLRDASASLHVNFTYLRFLDLSNNFINLSIPPWIQNFSKLSHLDLSSNDLQGIFPIVILENSQRLKFLDVSSNRLEGELLKNLTIFCKMQVLNLGYNKFSGQISDTKDDALICGQSDLKIIDVGNNNFSGHLPNQFWNFKNLESLDLSLNSISGPIPITMSQLSSLRNLCLSFNKLSGSIPESIGLLSNLELMDITNNQLHGVVNELHFANLTSLIYLFLDSNELVINVNASWVPLFQIHMITMSSCKVGPQFPNWLRTQRNIWELGMRNASISDEVPHWLLDVLSYVGSLDLSSNMLRGNISQIIGEKMPQLFQVSLSTNNLSGNIPNSLCMSEGLSFLDLSKNKLSGRLPQCWRKSQTNLGWISLGENKLNGLIPNSLCHLERLVVLGLHENGLSGVLPECLLKLNLTVLDLSDNQFIGRMLPFGQQSLSFAIINLERNYFTGDIPLQLCHLATLQYLSLVHNNISGGIPLCFDNFSRMWANSTSTPFIQLADAFPVMVNIKGTNLEFTKTLPYLFSIDLSSNSLDGQIPEGLTWLA